MPIQEGVVFSSADLARPCGVLFDAPCRTSAEDRRTWSAALPAMTIDMTENSRTIVVLVCTRAARSWNPATRNYAFDPAEDYIVAAFSVAAGYGAPFTPGAVARAWLDADMAEEPRPIAGIEVDLVQAFRCSQQGCNVSSIGGMRIVTLHENGHTRTDVMQSAELRTNGYRYGWRGGSFPGSLTSRRWGGTKPADRS
jgi:hypothetical protein